MQNKHAMNILAQILGKIMEEHLLQAGFNQSLTPIELAGVNDWLKPAQSRRLA